MEDSKGDGIVLTDKPGRRETQVRKAAGRWRLFFVQRPRAALGQEAADRIPTEDRGLEGKQVLTSLY